MEGNKGAGRWAWWSSSWELTYWHKAEKDTGNGPRPLETSRPTPSESIFLTRPHLPIILKEFNQLGLSVQTHEPIFFLNHQVVFNTTLSLVPLQRDLSHMGCSYGELLPQDSVKNLGCNIQWVSTESEVTQSFQDAFLVILLSRWSSFMWTAIGERRGDFRKAKMQIILWIFFCIFPLQYVNK